MKKTPWLLIIIASFNVTSCYTSRYYDTESYYPNESEYFYIDLEGLDMDKAVNHEFFILSIGKKSSETTLSFNNITLEEIIISTKDITYDMRYYIYMIYFYDNNRNSHYKTNQEITDFYDTGSIDFPLPTDEMFVRRCTILGLNPGISYKEISEVTLSLKIKIELDDGTIEHIAIEKYGKRMKLTIDPISYLLLGLFG